jgi:hypothetical protein
MPVWLLLQECGSSSLVVNPPRQKFNRESAYARNDA